MDRSGIRCLGVRLSNSTFSSLLSLGFSSYFVPRLNCKFYLSFSPCIQSCLGFSARKWLTQLNLRERLLREFNPNDKNALGFFKVKQAGLRGNLFGGLVSRPLLS